MAVSLPPMSKYPEGAAIYGTYSLQFALTEIYDLLLAKCNTVRYSLESITLRYAV
jgi:hypothetical protein